MSLRKSVFILLSELLFIFITKNDSISRVFIFGWIPFLYASMLILYLTLPKYLTALSFGKQRNINTLLCGSLEDYEKYAPWFEQKAAVGIELVGLLVDEVRTDKKTLSSPPRVLSQLKDIEQVIREHQIANIVFLRIPEPKKKAYYYYKICEKNGVRFSMINDIETFIGRSVVTSVEDGIQFISIRKEPLENAWNRAIKRLMDISISLAVIVFILPPLTLLVWIIQRIYSRGSIFHVQKRSGILNRDFYMIKYRTMHQSDHALELQATKNDPRVYPGGRWLRKYSLDEIPQFINVLKGEMSVVGPRPHLLEHNKLFAQVLENYHIRSIVKPGITGLAQVQGFRGEAKDWDNVQVRVNSDLYYIENWSLALDFMIILRTFQVLAVPPKTAY